MPPRAIQSQWKAEPPPEVFGDGNQWDRHLDRVLSELLRIYKENIEPVEELYKYDTLYPSWFGETIVQKKPFITLLGPFSAGKSTFINYLMQSNYLLTGPQPTTDKFTVIMHGEQSSTISGKVLVADQSQPFRGLQQFGEKFLECFSAVTAPHPILRSISLIDTPGVLENTEGDHKRRYDYHNVCRWFVERSDIVVILFDPAKLDVGGQLRELFDYSIKGHETKLRIILNKADTVSAQELMRVYGAMFWGLSNLIKTTEPPRVYVSSFWDKPYKPDTNHALFTDEKSDLLYDLTDVVPMQSLDNRVTAVITRAKKVYNHMIVCMYLKDHLPLFGKEKALKEMLGKLSEIYKDLAYKNKCNPEDFPPPEQYVKFFDRVDITKLPDTEKCAKKGWLRVLQSTMGQDLPQLLKPIKSAPVADPRDRKHAIMVQREYNQSFQRQLAGEKGLQGGLGEQAAPAFRAETLPSAATMMRNTQMQAMAQMLQNMQAMQGMQGMQGMSGMMPQQMGQQPPAIMPNLSHDQMMKMMAIMNQPQKPYQPRF